MDRTNASPIRILFLASDPSDATRLRLGQELREIRERLQLSKRRDSFVLESRESVRPSDITQAIFDVEPQIIHFSGHGLQTGELCFEDIVGKVQVVKPEALATLFKLVTDQVSCVILNACHSEIQANAIAEHIPFVIGMSQSIGDKAAIAFALGFYKALGAGRSFIDAYKFACAEIQLYGISEYLTPIIFHRSTQNPTESLFENDRSKESEQSNFNNSNKNLHREDSLNNFTEVVIHEFSTGIMIQVDNNGGWHSQGFTGKWMNSTLPEIPASVERAIQRGVFQTDYLSNKNSPAIIARVIADSTGTWSVIALITRHPDKCNRYFCAYRYFLCEEEDSLCKLVSWLEEKYLEVGNFPIFDPLESKLVGSDE